MLNRNLLQVATGIHFVRVSRFLVLAILSAIYLSVSLSHTRLVENRGDDDICYLRQASLFKAGGVFRGLDTDNPGLRYIARKIGQAGLSDRLSLGLPCHHYITATNKIVMQYPPGTGLLLSAFPAGVQVSGLYLASSTSVFLLVCGLIGWARTHAGVIVIGLLGGLTLYLMVNPAKASFSIAPTMPLCIALAIATVQLFGSRSAVSRISLAATAGLIAGVAVDVRLSSALLASGYAVVFAMRFLARPAWETFLQPAAFGAFMAVGALLTFAANQINAGSIFATSYSGPDAAWPVFDRESIAALIAWYCWGTHGTLTAMSIAALASLSVAIRRWKQRWAAPVLSVGAITLGLNLIYFVTHPIFSQYYTVPPAMLALWIVALAWKNIDEIVTSERQRTRLWESGGVAAATACAVLLICLPLLARMRPAAPNLALESNAVVWIGASERDDGLALAYEFEYRLNRHAERGLGLVPAEAQDRLIAAVEADCRPQYFVADDDPMKALVARLVAAGAVMRVGRVFNAEVHRHDGCNHRSKGSSD